MISVLASSVLLAMSISSDKIDTFMHLPYWFPTSVDAEHTFGSDDHTNCTHRTTVETLAAVESIFDAYHERVFYASEGSSLYAPRPWDAGTYGPYPSSGMQHVWFTNTLDESDLFVYPRSTNGFQRSAADTRRLVETDNLMELSRHIPRLFARSTRPFLQKGETWGTERDIAFGSSWGPGSVELPELVPIVDRQPTTNELDLANLMVPLYCCRPDSYFLPLGGASSEESDLGYLYEVLKEVDGDLHVLNYECQWTDADTLKGFLTNWHDNWYTNAVWMKTTVPEVITNLFPGSNPEFAATNWTRRLVPDDFPYLSTNSFVSEFTKLADGSAYIDLERFRATGTRGSPSQAGLQSLFTVSDLRIDLGARRALGIKLHESTPTTDVTWHLGPEFFRDLSAWYGPGVTLELPEGATRANPGGARWHTTIAPYLVGGYRPYYPYDADSPGWVWLNAYESASVVFPCYRVVVTTNEYTTASSLVATESRALAMLDRTYERPKLRVSAEFRDCSNTVFRSRFSSADMVTARLTSSGGSVAIDPPLTSIDFSFSGTPDYSETCVTGMPFSAAGEEASMALEFAKFSGTGGSIGVMALAQYPSEPGVSFTVADLLDSLLSKLGPSFVGYVRLDYDNTELSLDPNMNLYYYAVPFTASGSQGDEETGELLLQAPFQDLEISVRVHVSVDLYAELCMSRPVSASDYDRAHYPVSPGAFGAADGVSHGATVVTFREILERYSHLRQADGSPSNVVKNTEANVLPKYRDYDGSLYPPDDYKYSTSFSVARKPGVETGVSVLAGLSASAEQANEEAARAVLARVGVAGKITAERVLPVFPLTQYLSFSYSRVRLVDFMNIFFPELEIGWDPPSVVRVREGAFSFIDDSGREVDVLPGDKFVDCYPGFVPVSSSPETTKRGFRPSAAASVRSGSVIVTDWNWKSLRTGKQNK